MAKAKGNVKGDILQSIAVATAKELGLAVKQVAISKSTDVLVIELDGTGIEIKTTSKKTNVAYEDDDLKATYFADGTVEIVEQEGEKKAKETIKDKLMVIMATAISTELDLDVMQIAISKSTDVLIVTVDGNDIEIKATAKKSLTCYKDCVVKAIIEKDGTTTNLTETK